MKKKFYKVIMLAMLYALLATACNNPYDKITEEDEKVILFVIEEYYQDSDFLYTRAIDNHGTIYGAFLKRSLRSGIESGEIFEGEVIQTDDTVLMYYNMLREIDVEADDIQLDPANYPEAPSIHYYGILYGEEGMEIVELYYYGGDHTILDDENVETIVSWMEEWD